MTVVKANKLCVVSPCGACNRGGGGGGGGDCICFVSIKEENKINVHSSKIFIIMCVMVNKIYF